MVELLDPSDVAAPIGDVENVENRAQHMQLISKNIFVAAKSMVDLVKEQRARSIKEEIKAKIEAKIKAAPKSVDNKANKEFLLAAAAYEKREKLLSSLITIFDPKARKGFFDRRRMKRQEDILARRAAKAEGSVEEGGKSVKSLLGFTFDKPRDVWQANIKMLSTINKTLISGFKGMKRIFIGVVKTMAKVGLGIIAISAIIEEGRRLFARLLGSGPTAGVLAENRVRAKFGLKPIDVAKYGPENKMYLGNILGIPNFEKILSNIVLSIWDKIDLVGKFINDPSWTNFTAAMVGLTQPFITFTNWITGKKDKRAVIDAEATGSRALLETLISRTGRTDLTDIKKVGDDIYVNSKSGWLKVGRSTDMPGTLVGSIHKTYRPIEEIGYMGATYQPGTRTINVGSVEFWHKIMTEINSNAKKQSDTLDNLNNVLNKTLDVRVENIDEFPMMLGDSLNPNNLNN